ncbi:MAG: TOBE domain-containing protein, partial [Actinomycetota bacterium]
PADLFVAGFIGTPPMNTALAPLADGEARLGDSRIPLSSRHDGVDQAVVGVRPEHLRIDPAGPLRAVVRQTEWLGHEALLRIQPVGLDGPGTGWIARLANEDHPPEAGTEVRLVVTGPVHVFAADHGGRLEPGGAA